MSIVWKRKKIFRNYSNDINSFKCKQVFKKQHINTLYCFENRRSLDESSNSINGVFSKENRSYKIYWEIVPLNHYRGTIKRVSQYKSRVLFQESQGSF